MLEWPLQGRRGKRAVDRDPNARHMGAGRNRRYVQDLADRIDRRLEVYEARAPCDRRVEIGRVGEMDRNDLDAEARNPCSIMATVFE